MSDAYSQKHKRRRLAEDPKNTNNTGNFKIHPRKQRREKLNDFRHPGESIRNEIPRHDSNLHQSNNTSHQEKPSQIPRLPEIDGKYESMVYTHISLAGHDSRKVASTSYDRLEFLGDAYLELMATRLLFSRYPEFGAGKLSSTRELLIKNETLSEYALAYGMDQKLRMGVSSTPNSASSMVKIHGDVFEAYVGAIVQSDPVKGFEIAEDWMTALWEPKLQKLKMNTTDPLSKQELAKKVLAKGVKLNYIDERPVTVHQGRGIETYFVGVYLTGWGYENQHLGSGTGLSKVAAGMEAAARALTNHPLIDDIMAKRAEALAQKTVDSGTETRNGSKDDDGKLIG